MRKKTEKVRVRVTTVNNMRTQNCVIGFVPPTKIARGGQNSESACTRQLSSL